MAPGPELESLVSRTEGLQPWRRVFHAVCGLLIVGVLGFSDLSRTMVGGGLLLLAAGALVLDGVRLGSTRVNRWFFRLLRPFASPREARGIASSTWFLLGTGLTVMLFPRGLAIPALLVLALADPAASYLGRRMGRRPFGTGTVEGSMVFLGVSAAVLVPLTGWGPGLVTAFLVTVIERIPWPLDDNLTLPLATGALLWSLLPLF
jgi:dolichol kinase